MPTLDFKGKQFVYAHHLTCPFRPLVPVEKKSLLPKGGKPDMDGNLIIRGDNLHGLKALLPRYAGRVNCIFIDPPYNTGNEGWCYNDNVRSPLMREWLKKSANPVDKEDLERHDKWLCMMWPRLQLLKDLLAEEGSIWMTLDDNEAQRAKIIMDEVFGEYNFLADVIWEKSDSPRMDVEYFSSRNDHMLVYAKNSFEVTFHRLRSDEDEPADHYNQVDEAGRKFYLKPLRAMGGQGETREARPGLYYPLTAPDGTEVYPKLKDGRDGAWRWRKEKVAAERERVEWKNAKAGWSPYFRIYADTSGGMPPETIFYNQDAGSSRTAKLELKEIFGDTLEFATPKPTALIQRVLEIATNKDSLILDSFAGSGTTAHAVLAQNHKDGGNRKFILIQCDEFDKASDTYRDICGDMTAERVRRVIQGYEFAGTQREELHRENITFTSLKKAEAILERVEGYKVTDGHRFDKIKPEIKDSVLTVTGEKKVTERTDGLGGSFTYCELGEAVELESMLTGTALPDYAALASYVFYTATGQTLTKVPAARADGYIGETEIHRVHLHYQPDLAWMRSNEAALNETLADAIAKANRSGKRSLVFAAAKFMSQKDLTERKIDFCQLPFAIHRLTGTGA